MRINLLHKHYSEEHLQKVVAEMKKQGAPKIRAIWSETYGEWMAVEGCHRLRAAAQLGLTPTVVDISNNKFATIQSDGESVKVKVSKLTEELESDLWRSEVIEF
jgi:hypothetical protein